MIQAMDSATDSATTVVVGIEENGTLKMFIGQYGVRKGKAIYDISVEVIEILESSYRAIFYEEIQNRYRKKYGKKLDEELFRLALKNPLIKITTVGKLMHSKIKARGSKYIFDEKRIKRIFYTRDDQLDQMAAA